MGYANTMADIYWQSREQPAAAVCSVFTFVTDTSQHHTTLATIFSCNFRINNNSAVKFIRKVLICIVNRKE